VYAIAVCLCRSSAVFTELMRIYASLSSSAQGRDTLLLGSLIGTAFLADGSQVPLHRVWEIRFVAARLLLAAVLSAIRSVVCLRLAAFDACVIVAAASRRCCVIGRGLEARYQTVGR
jgi:hypothetical protein